MRSRTVLAAAIVTGCALLAACAGPTDPEPGAPSSQRSSEGTAGSSSTDVDPDQKFPEVLAAGLSADGDGYRIEVTVSSPYDTPDRYADGFRVLTPDGAVLAEFEFTHDHADEQPFTRARGPFEIPADVTEVEVEARDSENGYGGETAVVSVPR